MGPVRGGIGAPGSLIGADELMVVLTSCAGPSGCVWVTHGSSAVGVVKPKLRCAHPRSVPSRPIPSGLADPVNRATVRVVLVARSRTSTTSEGPSAPTLPDTARSYRTVSRPRAARLRGGAQTSPRATLLGVRGASLIATV
jgi:hypothetical protein